MNMNIKQNDQQAGDLPQKLSQPARRALASAGIQRLEQLTGFSEAEIKKLHGIGPNALVQLRAALAARGLSFSEGQPARISK
jgi:hypothetical protein